MYCTIRIDTETTTDVTHKSETFAMPSRDSQEGRSGSCLVATLGLFLLVVVSWSSASAFSPPSTTFAKKLSRTVAPIFPLHEQPGSSSTNDVEEADDFLAQMAQSISSAPVEAISIEDQKKGVIRRQAGRNFDKKAVQARLNQRISEHSILILSISTCPYCLKAKSVLDERGIDFHEIVLDKIGQDGHVLRAVMLDMTDRTSVPGIWVKGQFIGGCNEGPLGGIASLVESGKLEEMLEQ